MPTCYRHPGRETYIRCQRCDRPICPDCMRDAAVGYQCPECVSRGAKETRAGRTAFGGTRSGNPMTTSLVLIGINVVVFLAINLTGRYTSRLYDLLALRTSGLCASRAEPDKFYALTSEQACAVGTRTPGDGRWIAPASDAPWQVVTSVFTHVEIWHVAVNMLALFMLGPLLEQVAGRARFLALYLISGLFGSATVLLLADTPGGTVGASGALYGLMGALLVIAWRRQGNVQVILANLAINVVVTLSVPNISWQGHAGGFVGGLLVAAVLELSPRGPRRATWQVAGLAALALAALGAIVGGILTG